jgi:hypothetical protein
MNINWKAELKKVNQCPQRQDSTVEQLMDLIKIANKFGFYDACDYIVSKLEKTADMELKKIKN